jgi:hypothetical protein
MIELFNDAIHITRNMDPDVLEIHGTVKAIHFGYGVELSKIKIPKTVMRVFYGKNNVTEDNMPVFLPRGKSPIGNITLGKKIKASGCVFPESVITINLSGENDLTEIVLPKELTRLEIGLGNKLSKLKVPESVRTVKLASAKTLRYLVLPSRLKAEVVPSDYSMDKPMIISV